MGWNNRITGGACVKVTCCRDSGLTGREFAADLVEEIEDEADLVVHRSGLLRARSLQHGEAFAVGGQVKAPDTPSGGSELTGRPGLGLAGAEGVAGNGIGRHHDIDVRRKIKKFFAV